MFGRLNLRLQAQIFRETMQLRRDNRHLDNEQFQELAEEHFGEVFEGVDPDNLKLILEFLEKIIPIIVQLLPLFIKTAAILLLLSIPSTALAQSFSSTVVQRPTCGFPVFEKAVTEPAKSQPAWLDAQYKYPNWTYPGSIYSHLFEEPHYSRLKAAGYTDRQLRSISVREAELLHNHLHNYYGKFDSGANVKVYSPVSSST